jgi:hypothetical protein
VPWLPLQRKQRPLASLGCDVTDPVWAPAGASSWLADAPARVAVESRTCIQLLNAHLPLHTRRVSDNLGNPIYTPCCCLPAGMESPWLEEEVGGEHGIILIYEVSTSEDAATGP